VTCFIYFNS